MSDKKREQLSIAELETFNTSAERVCRDFDVFYNYMIENHTKISVRTGNIGKKDCFKINQLLSWKEEYEKEGYMQDRYAIIDFFLCFAYRLGILEKESDGKSGIVVVKGRNCEPFASLSVTARYLLLFAYLLSDYFTDQPDFRAIENYEDMMSLLEFCAASEPGEKVPLQRGDSFLRLNAYTYSGFLRIFQVMNICDTKFHPNISPAHTYRVPVIESVTVQEMGTLAGRVSVIGKNKDRRSWLKLMYEGRLLNDYIETFGKNFVKGEAKVMSELLEKREAIPQQQVYKLEISLRGYNCKRTIRIDSGATLQTLHDYIQELYDFDDDHMYSFTIGSGREKTEYLRPEAEEENSADEVTLGELGLFKGQAFTYLFDFGHCWEFTIKVKDSQEGTLKRPETVKAVGEPPQQYPSWDEDWE